VKELGVELEKIKLIESPNNSCEIFCRNQVLNNSDALNQEKVPALA